jgi:hypothetical protein
MAKQPQDTNTEPAQDQLRDRIKELRRVRAGDLIPNPRNPRFHDMHQKEVVQNLLENIGYAGALIAFEHEDGLMLVDGALRQSLDPEQVVPVLITDLSQDEADTLLATFDASTNLATFDDDLMSPLLDGIDTDSAEMRRFLTDLNPLPSADMPESTNAADAHEGDLDEEYDHTVDGMDLNPHEHYDYLVVMATNSHEWNVMLAKLGLKPMPQRRGRMATARAIRASQLLKCLVDHQWDEAGDGSAAAHEEAAAKKVDTEAEGSNA